MTWRTGKRRSGIGWSRKKRINQATGSVTHVGQNMYIWYIYVHGIYIVKCQMSDIRWQ